MIEVRQSATFSKWLGGLRDRKAVARITARIDLLRIGHRGDHKLFSGLIEMRIDFGPGYRVYAVQREGKLIVLLAGGDKGSQDRDIRKAKKLAIAI